MQRYNPNPETLGEHIKKARMERALLQKDIALLFGVSEDTVTYWENGRAQPPVKHYPAIIRFLGYYPFAHETETLGGKLRQIRHCNGLTLAGCASLFKVSLDAAKRWESGKPILNPKFRNLIHAVWEQLPNYIIQHP